MRTILLSLLAMACGLNASTVNIALTNFTAQSFASNTVLQLFYTNQPTLNGSWVQAGVPVRIAAPYGVVSTNLLAGAYQLTVVGQYWSSPLNFNVPNDTNTYSLTQLATNATVVTANAPHVLSIVSADVSNLTVSSNAGVYTLTSLGGGGPTNGVTALQATNIAKGEIALSNVVERVVMTNHVNLASNAIVAQIPSTNGFINTNAANWLIAQSNAVTSAQISTKAETNAPTIYNPDVAGRIKSAAASLGNNADTSLVAGLDINHNNQSWLDVDNAFTNSSGTVSGAALATGHSGNTTGNTMLRGLAYTISKLSGNIGANPFSVVGIESSAEVDGVAVTATGTNALIGAKFYTQATDAEFLGGHWDMISLDLPAADQVPPDSTVYSIRAGDPAYFGGGLIVPGGESISLGGVALTEWPSGGATSGITNGQDNVSLGGIGLTNGFISIAPGVTINSEDNASLTMSHALTVNGNVVADAFDGGSGVLTNFVSDYASVGGIGFTNSVITVGTNTINDEAGELRIESPSLTVAGSVVATAFDGSGSALTDLNASALASGTVAPARMATNEPEANLFLKATSETTAKWDTAPAGSGGGINILTNYAAFNVRHYGATGDGVTDDSLSISNADWFAAQSNQPVVFPGGTYLATNLTVRAPAWYGLASNSILSFAAASTGAFVTATNRTISGLTFYGGQTNLFEYGTNAVGSRVGLLYDPSGVGLVSECVFIGFDKAGVEVAGPVVTTRTQNSLLRHLWIQNCFAGLTNRAGAGEYVRYESIHVRNSTHGISVNAANAVVIGCNISDCYAGGFWGVAADRRGHQRWVNNTFNHIGAGNGMNIISNNTGGVFANNQLLGSGTGITVKNSKGINIFGNMQQDGAFVLDASGNAQSKAILFHDNVIIGTGGLTDWTTGQLVHWNNYTAEGVLVDGTGNPYYAPGGYGLTTNYAFAVRSAYSVFNGTASVTNGVQFPQLAAIPTNAIPITSTSASATNWFLVNVGGIPQLVATNFAAGGWLQKPLWP